VFGDSDRIMGNPYKEHLIGRIRCSVRVADDLLGGFAKRYAVRSDQPEPDFWKTAGLIGIRARSI
jgi:hypothetical protein